MQRASLPPELKGFGRRFNAKLDEVEEATGAAHRSLIGLGSRMAELREIVQGLPAGTDKGGTLSKDLVQLAQDMYTLDETYRRIDHRLADALAKAAGL